jgi:hypothetical protein
MVKILQCSAVYLSLSALTSADNFFARTNHWELSMAEGTQIHEGT